MLNENILRKVRKALALASNNPSEQEAQSAMLMAQRVLAEHGLSIQDVQESENEQEKNVIHEHATEYGKTIWWKKRLSAIVAENFRCFSYINKRSNASQIRFVGLDSDVSLAIEIFKFACETIQYHLSKYRQELKESGYRKVEVTYMGNDYLKGYLRGLDQKFKEQVEKNNWGLVLVKDALVVQEHESMNLKKSKPTGASFGGNNGAYERGFTDGKSFDSSRKMIAN
ncbi:hypothetical protein BRE01_31140 [Brevibacillus reuszeri]|uniref:DUF2786 domain-containing protein n=1 Tax=Brevibacillus reuszeri TaxID=54915 RepID=A0ABQ0TNF2_9BACL|nr:DUF2786 domain-containing protein [Brevibacillus reuszeri]MED1858436.1 DUF2786 domain-containing protein [Brevibacillus reuszeri]GED69412.1 hypothetical protein BRE01_31140 [Brevibacillus reuszeri]